MSLEAGKYLCEVKTEELKRSGTGNWMVFLTGPVLLHETDGGNKPVEGEETFRYYGSLKTETGRRIVKEELTEMGLPASAAPADIHRHDVTLVGAEHWFTLSYSPPKKAGDDPFPNWSPVVARASAGPTPELTDVDLAEVNALCSDTWGKGATSVSEAAGTTTASQSEWENEL